MGAGSSARGFEGVAPVTRATKERVVEKKAHHESLRQEQLQLMEREPRRPCYDDPTRYGWIPVEGDMDPQDAAAASEAPGGFAAPDEVGGTSPGRAAGIMFSKPRDARNAALARDAAAAAESQALTAASRASGLAGELQMRREVVMMPA